MRGKWIESRERDERETWWGGGETWIRQTVGWGEMWGAWVFPWRRVHHGWVGYASDGVIIVRLKSCQLIDPGD